MKKLALLFALVAFAPLANAATADTGSFDFWAWVESLFDANEEMPLEVQQAQSTTVVQANMDTVINLIR